MPFMPDPPNPLYAYVGALVDELARSGLRHAVVCPGSRSTPLALALADEPRITTWMLIDERSAAFFALGIAKANAAPVALVCTSGTAAANFYPAIVEANLTHVPLLALTADRPAELRANGAPQTIDQNRLYGAHVKWYAEANLPEATNASLRYIRTLACRAHATAHAIPAGPVHLNLPFREPLTPDPQPLPPLAQRDPAAWEGRPAGVPYVQVTEPATTAQNHAEMSDLAARLASMPRGIIIAGPQAEPGVPAAILALARQLGYSILADPLSGLRGMADPLIVSSYDAFLRDERFVSATAPEVILRFGAMPTSKPLLLYLKQYPDCPLYVVAEPGAWPDPTQLASAMIHADPSAFCSNLADAFMHRAQPQQRAAESATWSAHWRSADQVARATIAHHMPDGCEGRVFTELAALLPENARLFVGNSMPVRDCDTFFWPEQHVVVTGNRGANGIDGVISTALGMAAAQPDAPTLLVIGDLSFYHDLNGLLAAKLYDLNLTVVLVNNDGGGIFSFLPQAQFPEHFEQVFGTPTGLDFAPAVAMYGGTFTRAEAWDDLRESVTAGMEQGGLRVIEVRADRERNVSMHRDLWRAVSAALVEQGLTPAGEDA